MSAFRVRFTIWRMMVAVAILAIVMAWGVEHVMRSRIRFDFYDDRVKENEPLVNPVRLLGLEGYRVELEGEQFLDVEATTWRDQTHPAVAWTPGDLRCLIAGLEDELASMRLTGIPGVVDIANTADGRTLSYVRKFTWSCGTCSGPAPIHIPLFPRTVYRNRRLLIAIGKIKTPARPS
jgi:hypothetical protein